LINKIDQEITAETKKIENNTKDTKIDMQQLEFISLELEAVKLKSNDIERKKSSKEISERIESLLSKEKQRKLENNISSRKLDSLLLKKKELTE